MRRIVLVVLLLLPSIAAMAVFGYFALLDWAALQDAYAQFQQVRASGADHEALFAAWAAQDIHRVNLAADGAWFLLAGVIFAIGVHALCTLPVRPAPPAEEKPPGTPTTPPALTPPGAQVREIVHPSA